jgi:hypothetical protein
MELQGTDAKEGDNVGYITFGRTFKKSKQPLSSFLNVPLSVIFQLYHGGRSVLL